MEKKEILDGVSLIAQERHEQIHKHGFSVQEDKVYYSNNELVHATLFCIDNRIFQWPLKWDYIFKNKVINKDRIGQLVVAGAFIAAEIDRLQDLDKSSE